MNWIIKFNQLDKEYTEYCLDLICEHEKFKDDILDNKVYTPGYSLKYKIGNLDAENMSDKELENQLKLLNDTYIELSYEFNNCMDEIRKEFEKVCVKIREMEEEILDKTIIYLRNRNDSKMLRKRSDAYMGKLVNILMSLNVNKLGDCSFLDEIENEINILNKLSLERSEKINKVDYELLEELKQKQSNNYCKIFDYKDMVRLAERNLYKPIRCNGDHIIMSHDTTKKIVVIPAHELKFGLMIQIQKQIKMNKAI